MDNAKVAKSSTKKIVEYKCNFCDYSTCRYSNWKKHLATLKHNRLRETNKSSKKEHTCEVCGRIYKHSSSLCKHRSKCGLIDKEQTCNTYNDIVMKAHLYDRQKEEMNEMKEVLDSVIHNHSGGNQIINNNFNVNIILETQCADAISMSEFANKLQLTLEDLVYTKTNGYIEGVSHVFIKGLQELEPTQRPIQCSDKKGKNIYVKDTDTWEKDEKGIVLDNHISLVSKKQVDILKIWEKEHPNWKESESETKTYMELVHEAMGGSSNEERIKNHKLIQQKIGQNCSISDIIKK